MSPAVYNYEISINHDDLDELNHVNNVVYLRWVQEAAVSHWRDAAPAEVQKKFIWVVLRHEIDYKSPALITDKLTAKTWILDYDGVKSNRIVQIYRQSDKKLITEAKTTWVMLNAENRRPARITEEIWEAFSE